MELIIQVLNKDGSTKEWLNEWCGLWRVYPEMTPNRIREKYYALTVGVCDDELNAYYGIMTESTKAKYKAMLGRRNEMLKEL